MASWLRAQPATEASGHCSWWSRARSCCCRIGLHFMTWSHAHDGYVCACAYQRLWAEQIRW